MNRRTALRHRQYHSSGHIYSPFACPCGNRMVWTILYSHKVKRLSITCARCSKNLRMTLNRECDERWLAK